MSSRGSALFGTQVGHASSREEPALLGGETLALSGSAGS